MPSLSPSHHHVTQGLFPAALHTQAIITSGYEKTITTYAEKQNTQCDELEQASEANKTGTLELSDQNF